MADVEPEIDKLKQIRVKDAIGFINKSKYGKMSLGDAVNEFESLKLDEKILTVISFEADDSGGHDDLVKVLNGKIDEFLAKAGTLEKTLQALSKDLNDKITANQQMINDFLKISGMPYQVEITGESNEVFKTLFRYKNAPNDIEDRLEHLSYGEANALAIILFAIENRYEDSLIVLDDPISSFDSNKRNAIYNYLFCQKDKFLYGKDVLLMTHDFQTVVCFAKSSKLKGSKKEFAFLVNVAGSLIENPFKESDIYSSLLWYEEYAKNPKNDIYSRIVAARRIAEIKEGTGSDIYNYLAGLVHPKATPTHKKNGIQFSQNEIAACDSKTIDLFDQSFTYGKLFAEVSDPKKLITWYEDPDASKFAKTCIARLLVDDFKRTIPSIKSNTTFDSTWDFMCGSFHVETQYIYSIKGMCCDDIPNYVIALCDEIIGKIKKNLSIK